MQVCLRRRRSPLGFLLGHRRAGWWEGLVMGGRHAVYWVARLPRLALARLGVAVVPRPGLAAAVRVGGHAM